MYNRHIRYMSFFDTYKKYYVTALILGVAVLAGALTATLGGGAYPTHLTINEVSFAENSGNDWVEIYNPTLNSLSLKGYYLSDSRKNLTRFLFKDDVIVPSHGFVVLYGEKYINPSEGATVLSFGISEGETLYLVASDGVNIIDQITVLGSGASIGRFRDGMNEFFTFTTATPGEPNDKDGEEITP